MQNTLWILFSFLSLFALTANYILNRSLSVNYSPFLTIAIIGIAQFILSGILFLFSNEKISEFTRGNVVMAILVGLCVIGIDYGMITAYKLGGNSIVITLIVSMSTIIMVPISYIFFKEHLSALQTLGVVLSIIGLSLVILFPVKQI